MQQGVESSSKLVGLPGIKYRISRKRQDPEATADGDLGFQEKLPGVSQWGARTVNRHRWER